MPALSDGDGRFRIDGLALTAVGKRATKVDKTMSITNNLGGTEFIVP